MNLCDVRKTIQEKYKEGGYDTALFMLTNVLHPHYKHMVAYSLALCAPIIHMVKDDRFLDLIDVTMRWLVDDTHYDYIRDQRLNTTSALLKEKKLFSAEYVIFMACRKGLPDFRNLSSLVIDCLVAPIKEKLRQDQEELFKTWRSVSPDKPKVEDKSDKGYVGKTFRVREEVLGNILEGHPGHDITYKGASVTIVAVDDGDYILDYTVSDGMHSTPGSGYMWSGTRFFIKESEFFKMIGDSPERARREYLGNKYKKETTGKGTTLTWEAVKTRHGFGLWKRADGKWTVTRLDWNTSTVEPFIDTDIRRGFICKKFEGYIGHFDSVGFTEEYARGVFDKKMEEIEGPRAST